MSKKKKNDKRKVIGVSCNKRELNKVDILREQYQYKFRPKVFKQLLKEKNCDMNGEHQILKEGLKHMTKLMLDNPKYYNYDKEELEMLVVMYNDIIEHVNVFIIELREGK